MSKIFLCHASEDKKFVEDLAKDLMKFGLEVWYDKFEMKVGESLLEKINAGITGSGYFAVILSPRSVNKPWVKHEIQSAFAKKFIDKDFHILPILYEVCEMPLYLAGMLYADFTCDYENGLKDILNVFGVEYLDICTKENWRLVHKNKRRNTEWKEYKEQEYRELITNIFPFCYQNHWGIYVGGHRNPYSVTFSANYELESRKQKIEFINLRLCSDDTYKLSQVKEHNPNRLKAADYTIKLGENVEYVREKLMDMMSILNQRYGIPKQKEDMYIMSRQRTQEEKEEIIHYIMNQNYIFQGDFHETIRRLNEREGGSLGTQQLYI